MTDKIPEALAVLRQMQVNSSHFRNGLPVLADHHDGEYERELAVIAEFAKLIEAGNLLRQVQMHSAPWYEQGVRAEYAIRAGVPTSSTRKAIEKAIEDKFDKALAAVEKIP